MASKKTSSKKGFNLSQKFKELDWFGIPVSLNVDGEEQIKSIPGAFVSSILLIILLFYSTFQGIQVYEKNSNIQQDLIPAATVGTWINPGSKNIQMAFAMTDDAYQPKDDPAFVQWQAYIGIETGSNYTQHQLDIHKCTEAEMDKFYPVQDTYKGQHKLLVKNQAYYCISNYDSINLIGAAWTWDANILQYLSVRQIPCQTSADKMCNKTLEETKEYAKNSIVQMLYSSQYFSQNNFGEKTIANQSILFSQQFDPNTASYINAYFEKHTLQDQSSYFQVGQYQNYEFYTMNFEPPFVSEDNQYPSNYKIIGFDFFYAPYVTSHARQTYDILAWIGNVGGFLQGLQWIGMLLIQPLNQRLADYTLHIKLFKIHSKSYKRQLLWDILKPVTYNPQDLRAHDNSPQSLKTQVMNDNLNRIDLLNLSFFSYISHLLCGFHKICLSKKHRQIEKILTKGTDQLVLEHDLVNLIRAQRVNFAQIKCLLSPAQQIVTHQFADDIINPSDESNDDQQLDLKKQSLDNISVTNQKSWFIHEGTDKEILDRQLQIVMQGQGIVDQQLRQILQFEIEQTKQNLIQSIIIKKIGNINDIQNNDEQLTLRDIQNNDVELTLRELVPVKEKKELT